MTEKEKKSPELIEDETTLDQASGGLKVDLTNTMITSYQTGGSAVSDDDGVPVEGLSRNHKDTKAKKKR